MSKKVIDCPYFNQYDNKLYPGGSCNCTSMGMVLAWGGKKVPGPYDRIPDNLLHYCDQNGLDRHSLTDLQKLVTHFGEHDAASFSYSFEEIKSHLDKGMPVVVQGNFTPSGHVIVVLGYDTDAGKWLCNDPAGKFPDYGWTSGKAVWYDSAWFRAKAAPDGKVWAHLISK